MDKFTIKQSVIDRFKEYEVEWGPIGYFTYKRTYARKIRDETTNKLRLEEFWETVRRVVEGTYSIQKTHCKRLGLNWDEEKAQRSAEIMFEKIITFKFTPPGRGLWIMGTEFIERHGSMALNNCGGVSTEFMKNDPTLPFCWAMDALMLGVGVGFDIKGAGTIEITKPIPDPIYYIIPDSREGWVESLRLLLNQFFKGGRVVQFDYSQIRLKGEPIKGFGGVASGAEPLMILHNEISDLLSFKEGTKITGSQIVDIFNYIGKCVVAGNVRRSAQIALGDIDNIDFINLKQDKDKLKSHRWASNNSVIAKVGDDYSNIIPLIADNGEPGIIWLENTRNYSRMIDPIDYKDRNVKITNPCSEIGLEMGELCNLVEVYPSKHESYEEFKETLKYAYLYAKSITLLNTSWEITNSVIGKNRRIGTSLSGIIDSFEKHGRRTVLNWADNGYNYLRELDSIYSDWLCVPRSKKITAIKPSGTVSLLPGVSAGIHYPHSEYYIRRIRLSENSPLLPILRYANYFIQKDIYSPNTMVVQFPIHEQHFDRGKKEVSIWEQFKNAADLQKYWADNQVSITITFKPEEAKDIIHCLESFESELKGVSLLPLFDSGFAQMPYETIDEEKYNLITSDLKPLDFEDIVFDAEGEMGCETDACILKTELEPIKIQIKTKHLNIK